MKSSPAMRRWIDETKPLCKKQNKERVIRLMLPGFGAKYDSIHWVMPASKTLLDCPTVEIMNRAGSHGYRLKYLQVGETVHVYSFIRFNSPEFNEAIFGEFERLPFSEMAK